MCPIFNLIIDILTPCLSVVIGCAKATKKQCDQTFGPAPTPGPDGPYSQWPYVPPGGTLPPGLRMPLPGQSLSTCSSSFQRYYDTLYMGERDRKIYEWRHENPRNISSEQLRRLEPLTHEEVEVLCARNREEMGGIRVGEPRKPFWSFGYKE